jgi:UDP-N-acetyl-D-galactosamine dehydrogenase
MSEYAIIIPAYNEEAYLPATLAAARVAMAAVEEEYGIQICTTLPSGSFDAIVLAVRHDEFVEMGSPSFRKLLVRDGLLYDLKEILSVGESDVRI